MKGMETGMKVLLAVISILVVVLILLGIFTGGAQDIGERVSTWIGGVPTEPRACSYYNTFLANCTMLKGCKVCGEICVPLSQPC